MHNLDHHLYADDTQIYISLTTPVEIGGRSAGNSLKSSLCGAHAYRISELATSQPSYTQFHELVPGHAYGPRCLPLLKPAQGLSPRCLPLDEK